MSKASTLLIRFALCGLFFWFGVQQLMHPEAWVSFLPGWMGYVPIPGEMVVQWNGWFEVVAAALFTFGYMTRVIAALLGMHLLFIAISVGGAIGARDAALAVTTIAFAFSRPDAWTFDAKDALRENTATSVIRP